MIIKKEIVCGEKNELIDYFYSLTNHIDEKFENKLFITKEGLKSQLTEIENKRRGVGILYWMIMPRDNEFELKSSHISISDYIHPDYDPKK